MFFDINFDNFKSKTIVNLFIIRFLIKNNLIRGYFNIIIIYVIYL